MKHFNEDFEAVIYSNYYAVKQETKPKDGDLVPHRLSVDKVVFYSNDWNGQEEIIRKVILSKDLITSLYNQIQEIQSIEKDMIYENEFPF